MCNLCNLCPRHRLWGPASDVNNSAGVKASLTAANTMFSEQVPCGVTLDQCYNWEQFMDLGPIRE